MGSFDPDTFLDRSFSGELPTEYPLIPEIDEAIGTVKEGSVKVRKFDPKEDSDRTEPSYQLTLSFVIDDERAREAVGHDKPTADLSIWLDLDSEGNLIMNDKTKNVRLGMLLAALGIDPNSGWSFRMLEGRSARVSVRHETYNDRTRAVVRNFAPVA